MNYQVIIPARGGSKRFPGKNISLLGGLPLIAHTILYALDYFDNKHIWVNTDDQEISDIASRYAVEITARPADLGSNTTPTSEVLFFQNNIFVENNICCDAMILLQPTNPLRPKNLLGLAVAAFEKSGRKSLASFSSLNKKFGRINNDFFKPSNYLTGERMQDIEPSYFENGLIYITRVGAIQEKKVITEDVFPLVIDGIESFVDIDEKSDLLFAEFLLDQQSPDK